MGRLGEGKECWGHPLLWSLDPQCWEARPALKRGAAPCPGGPDAGPSLALPAVVAGSSIRSAAQLIPPQVQSYATVSGTAVPGPSDHM